jgi:hypothetical protein
LNRYPWDVRHAAPSEAPVTAPADEPDESLVVDARAGLTPSDVVESKLQYSLHGASVAGSHVRMGSVRARGGTKGEAPAPRPRWSGASGRDT